MLYYRNIINHVTENMKCDVANNNKKTTEAVRPYIAILSPLSTQAVSVLGTTRSTSTGTCIKKISNEKFN